MNPAIKNTKQMCHKAVVLGLFYTGYGIVRELSAHNVPVTVFDTAIDRPEKATRLAEYVTVKTKDELLQKMIDFAAGEESKPVLYLASDDYVQFYKKNRSILQDYYLIDFPDDDTVDVFLEKGLFSIFAERYGYSTPQSLIIRSLEEYRGHYEKISFPCVLKPFWRKEGWLKARFPKVFLFKSREDMESKLREILNVETNLIIQEFIPGGDREVYFHLMYYNAKSECVGDFTGRKLRQWPVGTGQTTCAEPAPWVEVVGKESRRIFDQVKYKGFGSVEFRRHPDEEKFYITEPTVGRQNLQSFVAAINGKSLTMMAYSELTGISFGRDATPERRVFWIDDQYDVFSVLSSSIRGCLNVKDLWRSYFGRKAFRLFNREDPGVGLSCLWWFFKMLLRSMNRVFKNGWERLLLGK